MYEKIREFYQPSSFLDLFDKTFKVIPRVFRFQIILCAALYLPVSIAAGWFIMRGFNGFPQLTETMTSGNAFAILGVWGSIFAPLSVVFILLGLASLFIQASIQTSVFDFILGRERPFRDCAANGASLLPRLILASILLGLALFGTMVPFAVLSAAVVLLQRVLGPIGLVLVYAGLTIGTLWFVAWLSSRLAFVNEAILFEGAKIGAAFRKSFALTRGRAGAVFGFFLLFGLILSFASTLATTPLLPMSLFGQLFSQFASAAGLGSFAAGVDGPATGTMAQTLLLSLAVFIGGVISLLAYPSLRALYYVDLKVRKGELVLPESDESAAGIDPTTSPDAPGGADPGAGS